MFAALKLALKLTAESGAEDPIATALATYGGYDYNPSPATLTSDGSTPVVVDGSVQTFADANGSGPTLEQTTASSKPIYRAGGYLDFDGNDSIGAAISPSITPAKFSLFIQFFGPAPQTNFAGLISMGTTSTSGIQLGAVSGEIGYGYGTAVTVSVGTALPAAQSTMLLTSQASDQKLYLNGGSPIYTSSVATPATLSLMRLGENRTGGVYWDGYVGRVLFLRDIPPLSEINAIGAAMEAASPSSWGWTGVS